MRHRLGSAPKFVRVQALRVARNLTSEFHADRGPRVEIQALSLATP
jgi:hypothetical protein